MDEVNRFNSGEKAKTKTVHFHVDVVDGLGTIDDGLCLLLYSLDKKGMKLLDDVWVKKGNDSSSFGSIGCCIMYLCKQHAVWQSCFFLLLLYSSPVR